jgi:hypothetical protein
MLPDYGHGVFPPQKAPPGGRRQAIFKDAVQTAAAVGCAGPERLAPERGPDAANGRGGLQLDLYRTFQTFGLYSQILILSMSICWALS